MNERLRPGLILAMRMGRRRARLAGDHETVNAISTALWDNDIQSEIVARLDAQRGRSVSDQAIGDGSWLKFLIENWEAIKQMIIDITKFFG